MFDGSSGVANVLVTTNLKQRHAKSPIIHCLIVFEAQQNLWS